MRPAKIRTSKRIDGGGRVPNAEGRQDNYTEQRAAASVDLHMPLENSQIGAGTTVFEDHPDNPGNPVKWRVNDQRGISLAPCIPAAIKLPAGAAIPHRYRLILPTGPLPIEQINRL